MSALPTPEPRIPSPEPQSPSPLRLPPSERDFEIYEAIHIAGKSTRCQADRYEISQTRVRQIVRRVVEWLGEVLPPQTKVAKEQETHLARQIAADRFQRQLEQITALWDATLESKYASIRIRLTTAQARLGAVGGIIDGLAADAIEGLPVPVWQAPAEATESDSPSPPLPVSPSPNPNPFFPPPGFIPKTRRDYEKMPRELRDPLCEHEITPEIVAARAAWGCPISPSWIKRLQDEGKLPRDDAPASLTPDSCPLTPSSSTPHSALPPPPPSGYCSPSNDDSAKVAPTDPTAIVPTPAPIVTSEQSEPSPNDSIVPLNHAAQPLLTSPTPAPIIEVRVSSHQPGATNSSTPPDAPPKLATIRPAPIVPA